MSFTNFKFYEKREEKLKNYIFLNEFSSFSQFLRLKTLINKTPKISKKESPKLISLLKVNKEKAVEDEIKEKL